MWAASQEAIWAKEKAEIAEKQNKIQQEANARA
jgi:hypothetical protein